MKQIITVFISLVLSITAFSQITSINPTRKYEGEVEYNKTMQKCQILEFNYPEDDLDKATEDYVGKAGGRVKSLSKGWKVAKGIRLHRVDDRYYDLYYKIDGKGKGDNARSTLYIIVSEPGENLVATADQTVSRGAVIGSAGATAFVSDFGSNVGEYDLKKRIELRQEEIKKAEKKYANLVEDGKSLETKRQKLEKEITDNQNAQATQQQELDRLKGLLEQMKEKKG